MPEEWNGWKIMKICNWYLAKKPGRFIWIYYREVPRLAGWSGNEYYLKSWLNKVLP